MRFRRLNMHSIHQIGDGKIGQDVALAIWQTTKHALYHELESFYCYFISWLHHSLQVQYVKLQWNLICLIKRRYWFQVKPYWTRMCVCIVMYLYQTWRAESNSQVCCVCVGVHQHMKRSSEPVQYTVPLVVSASKFSVAGSSVYIPQQTLVISIGALHDSSMGTALPFMMLTRYHDIFGCLFPTHACVLCFLTKTESKNWRAKS